jgi:outer membrane protein OmpA-like peptidoglycan-associated protein
VEVALIGAVLALLLSWQPVKSELVVVLPQADGHVGTVVVERGAEVLVLNRAYAASRIRGESAPRAEQLSGDEVQRAFGGALAALPVQPVSFLLYFVTGTDNLTEESKAELARMLEYLRTRQAPDIVVIGHTDTVGGLEDNDELSLQRAERVKAALVSQGIPVDHIRAAGRGEREPIVPTADAVDEPRNRRVEINVR